MILLAVVLFAALSYAVTSSLRGDKDASSENLENTAAQIIQFSTNVEQAVSRLRLSNGCTDVQISFKNPIVSGYTNSSSPSDGSCRVFNSSGGGLSYQTLPIESGGTDYYFTTTRVTGVSTLNSDLVLIAPNLTQSLCQVINQRIEGTSWTTAHYLEDTLINLSSAKFTGAYSVNGDID
jgi:hypothetical protein